MMSSPPIHFLDFTISNALHVAGILVLALICLRVLRAASNKLIRAAGSTAKAAQLREQNTRAAAEKVYTVGSWLVWGVALLTMLPEFGISAVPGTAIGAATLLALGVGARDSVRDAMAGIQMALEDQFAPGDTIQMGETVGRVEEVSLRRTVIRDGQGAIVSVANGEIRKVGNLSRDWSQAYVDVGVAAGAKLEKTLQALESAAAALRGDAAWSQALVDGPRVLGVQSYGPTGTTMRLQVRTAPTRQEEVCRELRRRIHLAFEQHGIVAAGQEAGAAPGTALT